MRLKLSSGAATVLFGALFVGGGVTGQAQGQVPVPESPPLSCSTANFTVTATINPGGVCGGLPCTEYAYQISSPKLNIDHTVFAVSATQQTLSISPTGNIGLPGAGDGTTSFLIGAQHEYAIRFNSNGTKSDQAHIFVVGASKPRVGTVLIRSGAKLIESCMIATPGVSAGDAFQPVFKFQEIVLAGGKCTATLVFDALGDITDIVNAQPIAPNTNCIIASPSGDLIVNGEPLKNNSGRFGITFGNGTTTCYGPPRPSIPKCVCTATPCP